MAIYMDDDDGDDCIIICLVAQSVVGMKSRATPCDIKKEEEKAGIWEEEESGEEEGAIIKEIMAVRESGSGVGDA